MSFLYGGDVRRGEIGRVPKHTEISVCRRRRRCGGGVINSEGEDEVEVNAGVYGDVGELDVFELRSDVLGEVVGVLGSGGRREEEGHDEDGWEEEKGEGS
ncbi:hypothetical protein IEQ34_020500 [Dendrobium chrysotoxum]|uniref:Uncharacterized protein n=1 Tax=Dendrobium chrysotoxum TaxID=161865 RepID=A0AAV7G2V5_DENCH|nr:hypothetical protein IEQ34_020500 [Dendrobium chrysotoxum]